MSQIYEFLDVQLYSRISRSYSTGQRIKLKLQRFKPNAMDVGVELQFSDIKSHNSIAKGERYHHPLRRIFNILCSAEPSLDDNSKLRICIKPSTTL